MTSPRKARGETPRQLPADLIALASGSRRDLRDGRFREITVDRRARTVAMVIDCGNLQVGYRRLMLRLEQVTIVPDDLQLLAEAIGAVFQANHWHEQPTVTEIRDVQVEPAAGARFLLRFRLWPFHVFAIEFGPFSVTETPLDDRASAHPGRFVLRGPD